MSLWSIPKGTVALWLAKPQDTQPAANIRQSLVSSMVLGGFLRSGEQLISEALKLANARFTDDSAALILSPNVYALHYKL